jgi:hypothetical protein
MPRDKPRGTAAKLPNPALEGFERGEKCQQPRDGPLHFLLTSHFELPISNLLTPHGSNASAWRCGRAHASCSAVSGLRPHAAGFGRISQRPGQTGVCVRAPSALPNKSAAEYPNF